MDNFYFAGKVPEIDFGNMAAVFFEGQERGGKRVGKIFCGGIFSLMELIFFIGGGNFLKKDPFRFQYRQALILRECPWRWEIRWENRKQVTKKGLTKLT